MAKLERMTNQAETEVLHAFACPACGVSHAVRTASSDPAAKCWDYNGDLNSPTIHPAIFSPWRDDDNGGQIIVCHCYIAEGRIRYLPDCTHAMAGKLVELPDL